MAQNLWNQIMTRPRLAIVVYGNAENDPRVIKQAEALNKDYDITLMSLDAKSEKYKNIKLVFGTKPRSLRELFLKRFLYVTQSFQKLENLKTDLILKNSNSIPNHFDYVVCNDIYTVPFGKRIAKDKGIILLDAHEYSLDEIRSIRNFLNFTRKLYLKWLIETYISKCDKVTCVSEDIAKYYSLFRNGEKIQVILNVPFYCELSPKVTGEKIKFVYHGIAVKDRKLHTVIKVFRKLPGNYELNLILVPGSPRYMKKLKRLARKSSNVIFHLPVSVPEIPNLLNQFDIGLFYFPSKSINGQYCLPNKFFEYIQARLAVLVTPNPSMNRLVQSEGIGFVTKSFTKKSLVESIINIDSSKINSMKVKSNEIARKYSFENEKTKYLKILKKFPQ
jgi:glycosyltransferase involved in cell wall biosynthesis